MKIFVAESFQNHSKIELISGVVGLFQEPINDKLFKEVKTIEQSDLVLVPHDAFYFSKYPEYLKYLNELSIRKTIVFSDRGDFPKKPKITNSIALRVALNPGESAIRKIVIPYNVENLGYLPMRKYASSPIISFMGYMPRISPKRIIQAVRQSPIHPIKGNGAIIRALSHRAFKQSNLDYHFVIRKSYGALSSSDSSTESNRKEYLDFLASSDMVLSPRGDANQSARFYETLSSGRIPLLPETSIFFPPIFGGSSIKNEFFLNFTQCAPKLDNLISRFWNNLDNNKYIYLQKEIRNIYNENFNFQTFIKNVFALDLVDFLNLAGVKH